MWSRLFISSVLLCAILHISNLTHSIPIDEKLSLIDLTQYGRKIYGRPDTSTGDRLAKYNPEVDTANPEELGSYLEGDILIPVEIQGRNALTNTTAHWTLGSVFYEISGSFDTQQTNLILQAIEEIKAKTCITIWPWRGQPHYVSITNENTGCWSSVGRIGGRQVLNLQTPGCTNKVGTVIHEFMHVLGFFHEQARTARQYWVNINWENIEAGKEHNFDMVTKPTDSFLVAYNYGSVMHYSPTAFSKNGLPTIVAKPGLPNAAKMGQRDGLADSDVEKIRAMYNCK